ncbi:hypothetical protein TNCV_1733431 [Trichonephila clavipes]|nr:hypothetical protein TNCV_1733431 [Trichonephila clavipes]
MQEKISLLEKDDIETEPTLKKCLRKFLNFWTVLPLKNINNTDSDEETERNQTAPVHTFEKKNIMRSMRNYLEGHFDGEMNNKMINVE